MNSLFSGELRDMNNLFDKPYESKAIQDDHINEEILSTCVSENEAFQLVKTKRKGI
jgi:hypothetical protein